MTQSPLSLDYIPPTLATLTAFAPPAAAAWARRSFIREPAGQTAACWLAMAILGAGMWVGFFYHWLPRGFPIAAIVFTLLPLLLMPPTLTWIGRRAKRRQAAALALWCAVSLGMLLTLGTGREFALVSESVMSAVMGVLSAWALAAQVRRAPVSVRQCDWFWILVGHVTYFAVSLFRMPVIETLVAHHWAESVDVSSGILLLFCATYLVIARGMLLGVRAASGSRLVAHPASAA